MKMLKQTAMVSVAAAALVALMFTVAEARTSRHQQDGMDHQRSIQSSGQWKQLSGTIKRTKQVEVRGQNQENLVVQLQTNRGNRTIVDLGNAERVEDLDLQKGDQLTVWGRTVNLGDKRVFMAHKAQANDETLDIDRQQMTRGQMRRHADEYKFGTSRQDRRFPSSAGDGTTGDNY